MSKQYHKHYKLAKELPGYPVGWPVRWDGNRRRYFLVKPNQYTKHKMEPGFGLEYNRDSYMIEDIESQPEWFTPEGKPTDYVPPFPSESELDEYVDLYFQTKLVDDVDVCRAMNELFNDKHFQKELYMYVKLKYEQFHLEVEDAVTTATASDDNTNTKRSQDAPGDPTE